MKMLATITYDQARRAESMTHLAAEQARVKELTEAGTLLALYIQADLTHVWLVLQGPDEATLHQIITDLPLHPFVAQVDLVALAE
ncbi:MAG: hypothetical protein H0X24_19680 [Ktedonobacterales bacterium]|nr:hypothetical protein [Ktedonobacterales bacterium]